MNVFVPTDSMASGMFLLMQKEKATKVAKIEEADVVLVTGVEEYRAVYREDKLFGLILERVEGYEGVINHIEPNAFFLDERNLFDGRRSIQAFLVWIDERKTSQNEVRAKRNQMDYDFTPEVITGTYDVLVIDDTSANLELAKKALVGQRLTTVQTLEAAVDAMCSQHFDAVLSDMQMSPDKTYSALNPDSCYGATEKVEYGFAAMFEATEHGIPVAIVTDGNHHTGWVSAMFDRRKEANVNGQKVLFFNNIQKRWDIALKQLLEKK